MLRDMTATRLDLPIYRFEAIDETLPFLPIAARRALDRAGLKLSLEGWLSLPLDARRRLVLAGTDEVDAPGGPAGAATLIGSAVPSAAPMAPVGDPDSGAPPSELVAALGPARPLDAAVWMLLRPLDRYALAKCLARAEKLARAYDEIVGPRAGPPVLSHVGPAGQAHMVDVGAKAATARQAIASAIVRTTRSVVEAVASGGLPKGDVLAVARVAGLLASKRTPELIPLCHPVQTTHAAIDLEPDPARGEIRVKATVEALDRTGVEMEAMVAASIASLTLYDMIKSADRWATVEAVRLEAKTGGKSGAVVRPGLGATPDGDGTRVALVDRAPSVDEAIACVQHPGAGAVCAFLGVVRDRNEGRQVVRLEYEAYPSMAVAEMRRIAAEIASEIPGVRLAAVHRTGDLCVGDVAVVCAASAPHRAEAYRACRALIDRVKARVPIWKREHGPDGAWWIGWQDARCEAQEHGPATIRDHDH
jgi:molybdenum cofactor biosynthesis protein MoaC